MGDLDDIYRVLNGSSGDLTGLDLTLNGLQSAQETTNDLLKELIEAVRELPNER